MDEAECEAAAESLAAEVGGGGCSPAWAGRVRQLVRGGGRGAAAWRRVGGLRLLAAALPEREAASALADCCLEDSAEGWGELGRLRLQTRLPQLLNEVPQATAGALARLIANLSADRALAEQMHERGAVSALMRLISNTVSVNGSVPTMHMAVRALRVLWAVERRRGEMVTNSVVEYVASLLCSECARANLISNLELTNTSISPLAGAEILRKRSNLIAAILKCLGVFSAHITSFEAGLQMKGTGTGLQCLVLLANFERFKSHAFQCIFNLCHLAHMRPFLGAAGAIKCVVKYMKQRKEYPLSLIKILSLFCREAVNRAKVCDAGGLGVLVSAIRDTADLTRHLYSLQALLLYIFDSPGLHTMAREGLIEILTAQLKDYVAAMRCEHVVDVDEQSQIKDNALVEKSESDSTDSDENSKTPGRRYNKYRKKAKECFSCDDCCPEKRPRYYINPALDPIPSSSSQTKHGPYSDHSSEYKKNKNDYSSFSPESSSSYEEYPACRRPCGKYSGKSYFPNKFFQYNDSSDSEVSERYSPVFTESEYNKDPKTLADLDGSSENESFTSNREKLVLVGVVKNTQNLELDGMSNEEVHAHRVRCLLLLLYQFSRYQTKNINLTTKDLLLSLMLYVEKSKYPAKNMALKTLTKIIRSATNFEHLLLHSIIQKICNGYQNPRHPKCKQCSQLKVSFSRLMYIASQVAETDYGFGHISVHLMRGDIAVKESLALTAPYMIKSFHLSKKIYMENKGLELFLNILVECKEPLNIIIPALSKLANNLRIRPPEPVFEKFDRCIHVDYDPNFSNGSKTIFVLDDASTVQADSDLLCKHSDVFTAMLHGSFKEGTQNKIRLQKVTKSGFEYLIILLQFDVQIKSMKLFPIPETLAIILETFLLADRFLLEKLKNLIFSAIVQFKLDPSTADKIYIWSVQDGMGTLCMESVAYTLVGHMDNEKRCRIVSTIMNSIHKDQWINHIKCSLLQFLE